VDPVKYEMFRHRLLSILEEGRITMIMVSGSPVIAEGGECMTSIYDGDGRHILTAEGLLFHCTGSQDAILKTIELYQDDPGIHEGDQFFYNDPYIAGIHLQDQIVVKPIFHKGKRVAWVGSMMHTSDCGGVLRGGSTEIFHEGIRFQGLKLIERGKLRPDLFRNLTQQCRDPDYVGLDLNARMAANNTVEMGYEELVRKYGIRFVKKAFDRLVEEGETLAKSRLHALPDGTWRSRIYFGEEEKPYKVMCAMTKKGDQITFDGSGSGPQNANYYNATSHALWGTLFVVVAGQLFWNSPWNGGMTSVVRVSAPEGSLLNCRYPASCGRGTRTGLMFAQAAHECISKMLLAGGMIDDVNAGWGNIGGLDGPGYWYGGTNQHGFQTGQGVYDIFGAGQGATPYRDGNDSGGSNANAQSMISDVEYTEMNFPFLYLSRNQMVDSAGYGKFRGGATPQKLMLVYGSQDFTVNYSRRVHGPRPGGWGLFGGYPLGKPVDGGVVLLTSDMAQKLKEIKRYPTKVEELDSTWGQDVEESEEAAPLFEKAPWGERVHAREYDIIHEPQPAGGGYGDPLDREPAAVARDVRDEITSLEVAQSIYGVVLDPQTLEPDLLATQGRRECVCRNRLGGREPKPFVEKLPGRSLTQMHEYLDIAQLDDGRKVIRCRRCGHEFCDAHDNYKKHAIRINEDISQVKPWQPAGSMYYQHYICPGCGTLLQVDTWSPILDDDEPLWDIQIEV
jgi:N-methylhydantoinase B